MIVEENLFTTVPSETSNDYEVLINNNHDPNNPFNFQYYDIVDPAKEFRNKNGNNFENYRQTILEIVKREYPIHKENLFYRLAIFFDGERVSQGLKNRISSHISGYLGNDIELIEEFYWLKGSKNVVVRIPRNTNELRKIEFISKEEIAKALFDIINQSYSIKKNDLFSAASKVYGYKKVGSTINAKLEEAYNILLKNNKIKVIDDKISIKKRK